MAEEKAIIMHEKSQKIIRIILLIAVAIIVTAILALVIYRLVTGQSLGIRSLVTDRIRSTANLARAVSDSRQVRSYSHNDFTNVIFLHHSVGHNLIVQGRVRERFTETGYSFWDQDYTHTGLRSPDGNLTGYSYNIPDDNTNPNGLARIFSQPVYGVPLNAFSSLLQHEVIIFKSCFPVSNISSDEQLRQYQSYYQAMRDVMDQHREKLFIIVTPPPLNPAETDAEAAARARTFANWLQSSEYLNGRPNIYTFDLFGHLAEDDSESPEHNMLRYIYRDGSDSHPNRTANETVGPIMVEFVVNAATNYRQSTTP